tara:strand:+ start:912 stop:1121 length:210 start_codon:yes stop_codon:yes gene_type:complete
MKISSRRVSLFKAISWRILATTDTFLIGFLITGNVVYAGSIASLEILTKFILYYYHERLWWWKIRTWRR